jgi:hypothetical protein
LLPAQPRIEFAVAKRKNGKVNSAIALHEQTIGPDAQELEQVVTLHINSSARQYSPTAPKCIQHHKLLLQKGFAILPQTGYKCQPINQKWLGPFNRTVAMQLQ